MIESIFFQPWVWIVPIVIVLCLVGGFLFIGLDWTGLEWGLAVVLWVVGIGLAVSYFAWMLPPYDASYYNTYRITGTLSEKQSAFESSDGTVSTGFVVKVSGIDLPIYSDDQRFRLVEEGDDVSLACTKVFNYFQDTYYDCNFGG